MARRRPDSSRSAPGATPTRDGHPPGDSWPSGRLGGPGAGGRPGVSLAELASEPDRDLIAPGHYEDVALRGGDDYPVYVELNVAHVDAPGHGALATYTARDT